MWVFTQDGFFSVVQHLTKPTHLFVRARRRGDLERLAVALGHDIEIEHRPDRDYAWAAVVERFAWRLYLGDCTDAINYTTGVKDQLDQGEPDRHTAMFRVWNAMMSLQEGGMYNNRQRALTGVVFPPDTVDRYSDYDGYDGYDGDDDVESLSDDVAAKLQSLSEEADG